MQAPPVSLTCEQCQRRKIKCDKKNPCGPCLTADFSCVAVRRPRRPRGRKVAVNGKSSELKERVFRLEALVRDLSASSTFSDLSNEIACLRTSSNSVPSPHSEANDKAQSNPSARKTNVSESMSGKNLGIASLFWASLNDEVGGLRQILDESSGDEDLGPLTSFTPSSSFKGSLQGLHEPLFPTISRDTDGMTPSMFQDNFELRLLDIYHERVDSMLKIGHWPSIRAQLTQGDMKSDKDLAALQNAICFMAICSLMDDEYMEYFRTDRSSCVQMFRRKTESCLAAANLLCTSDIKVLQAFVIYVAGLRTCESSQASWSLIALAIRIATAQGIHMAGSSVFDSCGIEARKRLWYTIGLLDVQTALDRGSRPLMTIEDFRQAPSDLDDATLTHATLISPSKDLKFTDMTFPLMTYEAMNLCRRLCQAPLPSQSPQSAWKEKVNALNAFKNRYQVQYNISAKCPETLASFTFAVSRGIIVTMELLLRRPLQISQQNHKLPMDNFNVLGVATEVLERGELKIIHTAFQKWQWFSWLKWFALAVVLAELCGNVVGPDADRAWTAVDACYERYGRQIADSASGTLWKPITKLYNRAKKSRRYNSETVNGKSVQEANVSATATPHYGVSPEVRPNHADLMVSDMSAAQLEAGALSWVNWEMFVDDMSDTTTFK